MFDFAGAQLRNEFGRGKNDLSLVGQDCGAHEPGMMMEIAALLLRELLMWSNGSAPPIVRISHFVALRGRGRPCHESLSATRDALEALVLEALDCSAPVGGGALGGSDAEVISSSCIPSTPSCRSPPLRRHLLQHFILRLRLNFIKIIHPSASRGGAFLGDRGCDENNRKCSCDLVCTLFCLTKNTGNLDKHCCQGTTNQSLKPLDCRQRGHVYSAVAMFHHFVLQ